ncbi:MAG: ABC transporter permease [Lachnospiraceae bacterium]|nr:ABC transporter permease [Lachnospiraceae bacterium]
MLLKLFRLELKKSLRCIPVLLAGVLLFGVLFTLVGMGLSSVIYSSEAIAHATVAVVSREEDDRYINMAIDYVGGMESAALALDFEIMEEDEAMNALDKGKVIAIILLPEHVIEGILYGENYPVRILFSNESALASVFLTELTRSGMIMLSSAQASTYTAAELYYKNDHVQDLSKAYDEIDMINFNYVLSREKLFISEDALPAFLSFVATGILLLLCFSHICYAPALKRENLPFYQLLFSRQISPLLYLAVKYLVNSLNCFFLLLLAFLILSGIEFPLDGLELYFSGGAVLLLALTALLLTAFALLLQQLFSDAAAVMLEIVFSIVMLFAGGAILPSAFLPSALLKIGRILPLPMLHSQWLSLISGGYEFSILPIGIYCICFFVMAYLVFILRKEARS